MLFLILETELKFQDFISKVDFLFSISRRRTGKGQSKFYPGSSLGADIDNRLTRDHLANNQQILHSGSGQQGSYNGPCMSEIRKDPNVQLQADGIIDALKHTVPVFANTNANMAGINPFCTQVTRQ